MIERRERRDYRQAADELRNHTEAENVFRLHQRQNIGELLLVLFAADRAETHCLAAEALANDVLDADERSATDEEDIGRIHLDILLLRVLAASLGRHVGDRAFEHFQKRLLDPFTRYVT